MLKRILMISFLAVLLAACNNSKKQNNEAFNIELELALDNPKQLKVSELGDSISYFELAPNGSPVKVDHIVMTDGYIFTLGLYSGPVQRFDLAGNYLGDVGAIGRGPGEYSVYTTKFSLDETNKEVLVHSTPDMLVYSFEGEYLRTVKMVNSRATEYRHLNNNLFCKAYEAIGNSSQYRLVATNMTGDTVVRIPNYNLYDIENYSFLSISSFRYPFYNYNNQIYLKGFNDNDTIFNILKDGHKVHAVINMGKFKRPVPQNLKEYITSISGSEQEKGDYYSVDQAFEDDNYMYLQCRPYYNPRMESPLVLFDKKLQQGYNLKDENGESGIIDDICGGATFLPLFISGDYYLSVTSADEFIERNENRENISGQLKELLQNIDYDSNPIVTLVKRKK